MRHIITLAALVLLFTAAWVSWEDRDGRTFPVVRYHIGGGLGVVCQPSDPPARMEGSLDGDVTRLLRMSGDRRDIWSAGNVVAAQWRTCFQPQGVGGADAGDKQQRISNRHSEEILDDNPYLEEATAYYGVEWARKALTIVRWRESSNIVAPCVVGDSGELGPYQFMADTWASTPYASLDPCDLETATWAATWMTAEGRQYEFTTWPRGGTP